MVTKRLPQEFDLSKSIVAIRPRSVAFPKAIRESYVAIRIHAGFAKMIDAVLLGYERVHSFRSLVTFVR
jgi:hypothetical protein